LNGVGTGLQVVESRTYIADNSLARATCLSSVSTCRS
jgi:hypothetical protein